MFRWLLILVLLIVNTPQLCCGGCSQSGFATVSSRSSAAGHVCPFCGDSKKSSDSSIPRPCQCHQWDSSQLFSDANEGEGFSVLGSAHMAATASDSERLPPTVAIDWHSDRTVDRPPIRLLLQRFLL